MQTIANLLQQAAGKGVPISEIVIQQEMASSEKSWDLVWQGMAENLAVMKSSVQKGIVSQQKSPSGLVGGDAKKLNDARLSGKMLVGEVIAKVITYAIAVNEVNASMGRIVACPTAGSCGILPAALLATGEMLQANEEQLIRALFTAAGIGVVIAENASISGAEGGCQAECGSAAAMAAGAIVELAGGTPEQSGQAVALALKNALGLVCDPVAGLVEVPCVKRNGFLAPQALIAADLALAGVRSVIPVDEVIEAMLAIGKMMPKELRETAAGGLAMTPTGKAIAARLFDQVDR